MSKKSFSYQKGIDEINSILAELRDNNVSIDDIQDKVTRATELLRACREKLRQTETAIEDAFEKGE